MNLVTFVRAVFTCFFFCYLETAFFFLVLRNVGKSAKDEDFERTPVVDGGFHSFVGDDLIEIFGQNFLFKVSVCGDWI